MDTSTHSGKLQHYITGRSALPCPQAKRGFLIGVLPGNGIGPEVISATLRVLDAITRTRDVAFEIRQGGAIGEDAEARSDSSLPEAAVRFCADTFAAGGSILNGPGGGRYVYDLRRRFDLFCKFVPVQPWQQLANAGKLVTGHLEQVDMLIVRDNIGGVYQGEWRNEIAAEGRVAEHRFRYTEAEIYRLIEVAARAAAHRRGRLHIVVKDGGVPGISLLWREVGMALARKFSVTASVMNVDLAAYELIQHPQQFDVLVAPNLIGDILADVAGVLVASRGLTFSGNFTPEGHAVYQTNHGCAHDLAGTDRANPAGQILSLAMLLRESFGLHDEAALIEGALGEAWRLGWRTADVAEPGCRIVGTQAMADQIAQLVPRLTGEKQAA
jgi:3-isopropylmalate dehydrogenase